jgi:hypothetical protein
MDVVNFFSVLFLLMIFALSMKWTLQFIHKKELLLMLGQ